MNFSLTGVIYLFGFVTISLLVSRFYQYWQKEKSPVAKIFFIFLALFDLFFFVVAVAGLVFTTNPFILKDIVIISALIQTLAGAVFGYLLLYLLFPRISPWIGAFFIFLMGLPALYLTIITPFLPIIEPPATINWNFPPYLGLLRYAVFLIPLLPYAIFCFNQARNSAGEARIRALSIGSLLTLALFIAPLDFFLNKSLGLGAVGSDIAIGFISFSFLIVALIIPKPSGPVYVTKIKD